MTHEHSLVHYDPIDYYYGHWSCYITIMYYLYNYIQAVEKTQVENLILERNTQKHVFMDTKKLKLVIFRGIEL